MVMIKISGQTILSLLILASLVFLNFQLLELKNIIKNVKLENQQNFQNIPQIIPQEPPQFPSYRDDCDMPLTKDYDLIFVYMQTCPHCAKANPIIKEYESEGKLKAYWINVFNESCWNGKVKGFQGFVPYFECLRNNKTMTGFLGNETLKSFLDECIKSK